MASSMGPAKMVTDGLVLHLDAGNNKSYPGSGTVWTDLSQTAITGSLTNGATFSSTDTGVIHFDGTNDYVGFNTTLGNNLSSITMESWVQLKRTSVTVNSDHILSKGTSGDYQYALRLQVLNGISGSVAAIAWQVGGASHLLVVTNTPLNDSNWHHIVGVLIENTSAAIYVDGVLHQTITTPSGSWNKTGNGQFIVGGRGDGVTYLTGSVSQVKLYNRALSANEVFQNYEATRERFNRPTIVTDDDARNFLNSANISSETQQRAVNDLVVDLKNAGLWGKMKAIYPFVGGTATTHKWNLKDPRDVDAAFRLQFNGGWTHSSNGADPNGTTAWADTYLNPSTTLSAHNIGLTYYSRENTSGGTSIGADNNSSPGEYCKMRIGSGSNIGELVIGATNVGLSKFTVTNSAAYFIGSATNSTTRKIYRNGVSISFNSQETLGVNGLVNYSLPLARNGGALTYSYDDKQCAFATIGDGLTDSDASNLYTIVQKYQTTLGRQV